MICITVMNTNIPLVCKIRKATVEIISKQLEYVTKGHIAMYIILFLIQSIKFLPSSIAAF